MPNIHSRWKVMRKYIAKSHYAYAVARRYLQRRRITILTFEGARSVRERMMDHFERRDIYVHDEQYVLSFYICRNEKVPEVYLEGERVFVSAGELIALQSKYRKSGKLGEWDRHAVEARLNNLILLRKEREFRRLNALARSFANLLRAPHDKRAERATYLLNLHSERI